jgi:hypothetical protein
MCGVSPSVHPILVKHPELEIECRLISGLTMAASGIVLAGTVWVTDGRNSSLPPPPVGHHIQSLSDAW